MLHMNSGEEGSTEVLVIALKCKKNKSGYLLSADERSQDFYWATISNFC